MIDITLCSGNGCTKRETCVRFTTHGDSKYQSCMDASDCIKHAHSLYWPQRENCNRVAPGEQVSGG